MDAKTDQYMALLDQRNTPSQRLTSSPVQRFMSRRTRSVIPIAAELLVVKETEQQQARVKKQAKYYNMGAKLLPPLKVGDVVRMKPYQLGNKKVEESNCERKIALPILPD